MSRYKKWSSSRKSSAHKVYEEDTGATLWQVIKEYRKGVHDKMCVNVEFFSTDKKE